MRSLLPVLAFAVLPVLAQGTSPRLVAAVVPGSTEAVVSAAVPGSLAALVLGTVAAPVPLPGGVALDLEPAIVAGIGLVGPDGRWAMTLRFPVGSGAGATFLAQALVLDLQLPLGMPGALAVTPMRALRVPEVGAVADIVVLFGQSNMEGRAAVADLPADLRGPMPCSRIWNDVAAAWQPLTAGLNNTTFQNPEWTGPEMTLADELSRGPSVVWFVKFAVGQTSLGPTPGPWNEWDCRAGELYVELLRRIDAACGAARALGLQPRVRAICMMQGESDAVDPVLAEGYRLRLLDLVTQLRSDLLSRQLTDDVGAAFVLGLVNRGLLQLGAVAVDAVRVAQLAVVAELPRCAAVETTGMALQQDGVHLSTAGVCALGRAFARALAGLDFQR